MGRKSHILADVFRIENVAKGEKFLISQRLDRHRVIRATTLTELLELHGLRDQRFPRTGGGVKDDVLVLEEFEDGLFLVVVRLSVSKC